MSKKLSKVKAISLINNTKGKFFTAEFIKKDGTPRKMVARTGVTKHLKGGKNNVVKDSNSYVSVYDVQKKGYRVINLDTLKSLKVNHTEYEIV